MIGLRDTARTVLTLQLTEVASTVIYEAKRDRDKLLSSAFELYKYSDASPLGPVTGFKLMDAEVGIGLKLMCDGVKYRVSYSRQIPADLLTTDSAWTTISITSKGTLLRIFLPILNSGHGSSQWVLILKTSYLTANL